MSVVRRFYTSRRYRMNTPAFWSSLLLLASIISCHRRLEFQVADRSSTQPPIGFNPIGSQATFPTGPEINPLLCAAHKEDGVLHLHLDFPTVENSAEWRVYPDEKCVKVTISKQSGSCKIIASVNPGCLNFDTVRLNASIKNYVYSVDIKILQNSAPFPISVQARQLQHVIVF